MLNTASTRGAVIDISPSVITEDTPKVTVAVAVPIDNNSWVAPFFFSGRVLNGELTMKRERALNSSFE